MIDKNKPPEIKKNLAISVSVQTLQASLVNPDISKALVFFQHFSPLPAIVRSRLGKCKMKKRHVEQNISANNNSKANAGTMNLRLYLQGLKC
jgi:hypothetical protein